MNYPLLSRQTEKHTGSLSERHSFLELNAENVVLTTVRKAEDDGAVIYRYYEWAGKENDIVLRPDSSVSSAEETDLMERPVKTLDVGRDGVTIHTKPFEIKTVRLRLNNALTTGAGSRSPQ